MAKICEAAALHLAAGALEKREEVPVGQHALGGVRVILDFPDFAMVIRGEGEGDGYEAGKIPSSSLTLNMAAVALFLHRSEIKGGAKARRIWAECIRDSLRGMSAELPVEAALALAEVQAEQPAPELVRRKCAAKRTGTDQVKVMIQKA